MTTSARVGLLVFMDTSTVSGPLRQLVAALEDLQRDHAVDPRLIIGTRRGRDVAAMRSFLAETGLAVEYLEERARFDWRILRRYRALLRDPAVRVVQSHGYKPTIHLALLRFVGGLPPWITVFHGRTHESRAVRLFDTLAIRCARWADRIVVVAGVHRALFRDSHSVRHIPNAITVVPASAPPVPAADGAGGALLFVGRLSPEKGLDVLLQAMVPLVSRDPAIRLRLIGDGPARAPLERQIDALGLRAHVELIGQVDDPAPYYAEARLLCLPSRTEAMPNVVLEALAAGVPVVATAVGDVGTMVDTDLGRLVPPGDVSALAEALYAEWCEPRGASYLQARERLLQRFGRAARAEALRALYDELLAANG